MFRLAEHPWVTAGPAGQETSPQGMDAAGWREVEGKEREGEIPSNDYYEESAEANTQSSC